MTDREGKGEGERQLSYDRLSQLVDRTERTGGFVVTNYQIKVDDETLSLIDTIRFREICMDRQRERELDKSKDYKASRAQGYQAAVSDMKLALGKLQA